MQSDPSPLTCPAELNSVRDCQTPHSMRLAYGVESLVQRGFTGKGQTVVIIDSFGSPLLQQDLNAFDAQFDLPQISVQVLAPLGTVKFDSNNKDMVGWAEETTLDVEMVHAIAPGANIVVLTSPVSETEGTIGLPQFLQLEQYAVDHHLGNIVSQSWAASEITLKDAAGQQEIQKWDAFFKQATTQQGITFFSGSGDNGATDYADLQATKLSTTPTTDFPADDPYVMGVGGTTLIRNATMFQETAWSGSGGGFSQFFPTPSFQQSLPAAVQSQLNHRRGVPDVSGDANPSTAMANYFAGQWLPIGGTSAATPLWAAIMAIADQMAGHALGYINPGLYKVAQSAHYAQDFHDIVVGNNSNTVNGVLVQGYSAVTGWDPVTGLGSPNAEKLLPDLIAALS
jgi:subtilase family serine protease